MFNLIVIIGILGLIVYSLAVISGDTNKKVDDFFNKDN